MSHWILRFAQNDKSWALEEEMDRSGNLSERGNVERPPHPHALHTLIPASPRPSHSRFYARNPLVENTRLNPLLISLHFGATTPMETSPCPVTTHRFLSSLRAAGSLDPVTAETVVPVSRRRKWPLQQKAWLVTAGVLFALAGLIAVGVDAVFRHGSAELENQWIEETARRVQAAQAAELESLERCCRDYSNWVDTYAFIDDPSLPYIATNLLPSMFANLRLDAFFLFHRDTRLRLGRSYDGEAVHDTGVNELAIALTPFAKRAVAGTPVGGILRIDGQFAAVAVLPVVYDDGSGTPNGALAEVRLFSPAWLGRLRKSLNMVIVLRDGVDPFRSPLNESTKPDALAFTRRELGDHSLELHLPLHDLEGRSVGYWQVMLDRKIHVQGIRARQIFYTVLAVLIVAAAAVIGALLRGMVIGRLEALQRAVERVRSDSDLSVRLPVRGTDELASLTNGFNGMLEALAEARESREKAERDRARLSAQLQEAQKLEAIGTLAAGLAHDFNNLLTSIQGSVALIRFDTVPDANVESHLDRIEQASKRAAGLVQQMTAFGRRGPTIFENVQLSTVVTDTLKLVRASIPRRIEFRFQNNARNDLVYADAGQLQQALINLATNSSHAMADGTGMLSVSLETVQLPDPTRLETQSLAPGEYVRLVFADQGCGIPTEQLNRVFEPFFTTKPVGSGTGLGLAVVHGIIGNHDGVIGIESTVGVGTQIFIHLPARPPSARRAIAIEKQPASIALNRKARILLVDDDDLVRTTLESGLKRKGYDVVPANSANAALNVIKTSGEEFDVMITDQTMPAMTGLELGERVAQLRPRLPKILMSGYAAALNERKVKALGFAGMIMKPVTLEELHVMVQTTLLNASEKPTENALSAT